MDKMGGYPNGCMVYSMENGIKWMMTGGSLIFRKLHIPYDPSRTPSFDRLASGDLTRCSQ